MKLTYFSRFPLLAGLMALWLSLSGAQAATGLPAAEYAPRSGELTPREMTIAKNAWQYFVANFQPTTGLVNAVNKYPSSLPGTPCSAIAGAKRFASRSRRCRSRARAGSVG